jgi:hypothetical protein
MRNRPLPEAPPVETVDGEEALNFVHKFQEAYRDAHDKEAFVERYLDQFTQSQLRSVGRRILMDLMKRPQIDTKAGPWPEPEPPWSAAPAHSRPRRVTSRRRPPSRSH